MVIRLVEPDKLLIGQFRYKGGIAAGLVGIAVVREQNRAGIAVQHALRRGEGALHLIVNHAVDGQVVLRGLHLIVPSLLQKDLGLPVNPRVKHAVHIHVHQVPEILVIAAGYRINGLVRVGHGVQEGVQRPLHQLHKGILHRKFLRSLKHAVLQDVRKSGAVLRRGAKSNAKHLVIVVVGHQENPGAAFHVLQNHSLGIHFLDVCFL